MSQTPVPDFGAMFAVHDAVRRDLARAVSSTGGTALDDRGPRRRAALPLGRCCAASWRRTSRRRTRRCGHGCGRCCRPRRHGPLDVAAEQHRALESALAETTRLARRRRTPSPTGRTASEWPAARARRGPRRPALRARGAPAAAARRAMAGPGRLDAVRRGLVGRAGPRRPRARPAVPPGRRAPRPLGVGARPARPAAARSLRGQLATHVQGGDRRPVVTAPRAGCRQARIVGRCAVAPAG